MMFKRISLLPSMKKLVKKYSKMLSYTNQLHCFLTRRTTPIYTQPSIYTCLVVRVNTRTL
jgi:hypothetical protein